jgi:xylan 1,4-beta-xylosidase
LGVLPAAIKEPDFGTPRAELPVKRLNSMSNRLLVSLLLALPITLLAAQEPASRVIDADLSRPLGEMSRMYNFCVGAGRANEGLRADWQRQLRRVRADCGFRYIRFHGLFCDDMGVYREDRQGRPIYNWQYVDELIDFLESIGMKPFVELSFMPGALASGPQTIFWYKANVTPPKDYAKWEALVAAFVRHATERYGAGEVRTWYFEVWNEPNLTMFWIDTRGGRSTADFVPLARAEYYRLYTAAARAVKSVDAAYRVGGPATAGSGWIDETLAYCAAQSLPLDFVSTHSYATRSGYLDENGDAGTVFSSDRDAITGEVRGVRAKIDRSGFPRAELHYTEWSSSYTPFDPIHDSYHSAAFILDKIRHVGNAATSMSYWTFTDIFEEAGPRATPFHGGFGMLNYQDIAKPSYFAFRFLNRLGDTELASADPDAFICRGRAGAVQALFWDFTITHPGPSVIDQEYYRAEHPANPKGAAELRLTGLRPGAYRLAATKVGYRANDVQSAWRDLGSPSQLTRAQVEALKRASSGEPILTEKAEVGAAGTFSRRFEMRENDVWFVELSPI